VSETTAAGHAGRNQPGRRLAALSAQVRTNPRGCGGGSSLAAAGPGVAEVSFVPTTTEEPVPRSWNRHNTMIAASALGRS
jgi:hypothetical protein